MLQIQVRVWRWRRVAVVNGIGADLGTGINKKSKQVVIEVQESIRSGKKGALSLEKSTTEVQSAQQGHEWP